MSDGQPIWITTDTHLGHTMLTQMGWRPEGFTSLVLDRLAAVEAGSLFIHLGDVALAQNVLGMSNELYHRELLDRVLQARTRVLIRGNHDYGSPQLYNSYGWDLVVDGMQLDRWGHHWVFSHKPLPHKRVPRHGYNVHGHTHGNPKRDPEAAQFFDRNIHVELALENNNYRPWKLTRKLPGVIRALHLQREGIAHDNP